MCAIAFIELVLPAGVRNSIPFRGQTCRLITCLRRKVRFSNILVVILINLHRLYFRANKYLQKSSVSRVCAIGGFFISIPIFLTGKPSTCPLNHKKLKRISTPTISLPFRYNSLHFHSVPFDAGDRYEHSDWHWDSLLWWRHGAQRLHLAEGEDNCFQLHETAATSNDANAAKHSTPQQFDAPNAATTHRPPNTVKFELVVELTTQSNS